MAFRIQSTHRFVNPRPEPPQQSRAYFNPECPLSEVAEGAPEQPSQLPHQITTDSMVTAGSSQGLAIRTDPSSMEDYY